MKKPYASRRSLGLALAFALLLALGGCSTISDLSKSAMSAVGLGPKPVVPDWKSVTITAADDANNNSAVAIDLVFVRDQALLDTLATTPAAKWFSTRNDILRSFPDNIAVMSYELVPRQSVRIPEALFEKQKAWGVLAFAGYPPPGDHRARLKLDAEAYLLQLGRDGLKASEVKAAKAN
jgi:type VI secretion system protein